MKTKNIGICSPSLKVGEVRHDRKWADDKIGNSQEVSNRPMKRGSISGIIQKKMKRK